MILKGYEYLKLHYQDDYIKLVHGDCLDVMDSIIDKNIKVDMILADLPQDYPK